MTAKSDLTDPQELSLSVILALQAATVFILSPLIDMSGGHYRWLLDVFLATMAFVSVFTVKHGVWRWLAMFTFALCLSGLFFGQLLAEQRHSEIIFAISGLLFSLNLCWIVAHKVFNDGPISLHRIRGAIVIYLNIALLFALMDSLLVSFVPDAYSNLPKDPNNTVSAMVYFSLATLTTVGYGDIIPAHPLARSLAMLEAVIGQFYIGILVATLVGLHVSHRQSGQGGNKPS